MLNSIAIMKEVDWSVRAFTMNLFVFQLSKKPLAAVEFVAPLARIDPIYKEEEEAFKVNCITTNDHS